MLIEVYLYAMYFLLFCWFFLMMDYTSSIMDYVISSLPDIILGFFVILIYELYYINA